MDDNTHLLQTNSPLPPGDVFLIYKHVRGACVMTTQYGLACIWYPQHCNYPVSLPAGLRVFRTAVLNDIAANKEFKKTEGKKLY